MGRPTEGALGITVPDGDPGAVRDAARGFRTAGHGLQGAASDIRAVPGLAGDWQGPASATFHGSTTTNGQAVDQAVGAMASCAHAASAYADELERCQTEARRAVADAQDAQKRIDAAEGQMEAARQARANAYRDMDSANQRIAVASVHGAPAVGAHDDLA